MHFLGLAVLLSTNKLENTHLVFSEPQLLQLQMSGCIKARICMCVQFVD